MPKKSIFKFHKTSKSAKNEENPLLLNLHTFFLSELLAQHPRKETRKTSDAF
jgi:hypothetical protein